MTVVEMVRGDLRVLGQPDGSVHLHAGLTCLQLDADELRWLVVAAGPAVLASARPDQRES